MNKYGINLVGGGTSHTAERWCLNESGSNRPSIVFHCQKVEHRYRVQHCLQRNNNMVERWDGHTCKGWHLRSLGMVWELRCVWRWLFSNISNKRGSGTYMRKSNSIICEVGYTSACRDLQGLATLCRNRTQHNKIHFAPSRLALSERGCVA